MLVMRSLLAHLCSPVCRGPADDAQAVGPPLQSSFCSGPADADDAQALGPSLQSSFCSGPA